MNKFVIGDNELAHLTMEKLGIEGNFPDTSLRDGLGGKFLFICLEDTEEIVAMARQVLSIGRRPIHVIRSDGYIGFTDRLAKICPGTEFVHNPEFGDELVVIGGRNRNVNNAMVDDVYGEKNVPTYIGSPTETEFATKIVRKIHG